MNKFVLGALALSATSAPSLAGTGTEDWTSLDKDINSLSSSLAPQTSPATVTGFVKTSYAKSWGTNVPYDKDGNGIITAGEGNDLGGFSIDVVRVNIQGTMGRFGMFISVDGASEDSPLDPGNTGNFGSTVGGQPINLPSHLSAGIGEAGGGGVLDAYVTVDITNELRGQVGVFRAPFLAESMHSEDQLLFMDRSALGDYWSGRDEGAQVGANFGQIGIWGAVMNGMDGAGDRAAWAARAQFTSGTAQTVEGAYGANGNLNFTLGAGYYDDNSWNHAQAWCADATLNMGAFSASAEIVDHKKDLGFVLPADDTIGLGAGGTTSSNTFSARPWNATASFLFLPDWEVAARYEDFDDGDDTYAITGGINWYQSGHAAKVQLNYSDVNSDSGDNDLDLWQIGLTASI